MKKVILVLAGMLLAIGVHAECIEFGAKYDCDNNWHMKIYSKAANDIYTYRFGYVGIYDFIADGAVYPMKGWPSGSTYFASCGPSDLDLHQVWLTPDLSTECKGATEKIVYATQIRALSLTGKIVDGFSYIREEAHYCSSGEVIVVPAFVLKCNQQMKH